MIDQLRDTLRKASKVVEAPRKRTEEAVRKMAEKPNFDLLDAQQIAREVLKRGREQAGKAKSVLDDNIRRRLNEMGLATKDELDRLHRRIAELEAAAAAGSAAEAPPGPATPAEEASEAPAPKPRATRATRTPRAPRAKPAAKPATKPAE